MQTSERRQRDPNAKPVKRLKVGFVLARSFTLSAFALFVDTLRLASDHQDRSGRLFADWQVLASTPQLISSSCGVQVARTSSLGDPTEFDYIVIVGGLLSADTPVDAETIAFLRRSAEKRVPLIGLCTGSFILAEAGLMKYHVTCVSWLHFKEFRERFPDLAVRSDRIFNLDPQRGSCAGGSSAADMAASLVRQYISRKAEQNAMEVLQIEKARSAADVQTRRPLGGEYDDPRVIAAMIAMEQHLDGGTSIARLADSIGVSPRHLERIFLENSGMSPADAYTRIRMERAKALLTETNAPIIGIALEVGFESHSSFTRAFRRTYGRTPSEVRSANVGA